MIAAEAQTDLPWRKNRGFQRYLTFLAAALCFVLPRTECDGFSLFSGSWGDVIVVTDMTADGRALTPPTLEKPVYYLGKSLGCKLGSMSGDQLPEETKMNNLIVKVLAKQGYLSARSNNKDREPTLYLVLQWGYLEPRSGELSWFLGYDASKDIGAPVFPGMLGPEVFRRNFRSQTIETILESARDPIYGIIVTAIEYKSARTPKPIIYWQSRIGLPANGKSMAQALPTMILAAGPTFGQETDSPVLRDTDAARKGRVELGELEVSGYEDGSTPPSKASGAKK